MPWITDLGCASRPLICHLSPRKDPMERFIKLCLTLLVLGPLLFFLLIFFGGCEPSPEVPTIPPPPEDLCTWTVPELVQPPVPVPASPAATEEHATKAEKV